MGLQFLSPAGTFIGSRMAADPVVERELIDWGRNGEISTQPVI
jgi:hypothetical protein